MASRSVSPGGALLRASRVFSIPPPLPKPMGELSAKAIFTSDTATLPHPIHLSITTPPSSRAKGDWGFKRPLPLRSTTKTSTPFIRVEAIDTFEHITEFGSSADHAMSLKKWQEMGVAVTVPVHKKVGGFEHGERKSVFEDDMDSTVEPDIEADRGEDVRWSFKGPWLAGMTDGDFNAYVRRQVGDKKSEFRKYLRRACAKSLTAEARRNAIDEEETPVAMAVEDITETQMTEYVKVLRHDRTELYRLIRTFLDLPPAPPNSQINQVEDLMTTILENKPKPDIYHMPASKSPYAVRGPPKTHPSAGMAYSLTDAQAFNHPEFGPQKFKSPIEGRVVLPQNASVGSFQGALGVGGFVTPLPPGQDRRPSFQTGNNKKLPPSNIPGAQQIEPDKVGGSKVYVEPIHAQVDPNGHVVMTVALADSVAVAVKEGTTDQIQQKPLISRAGLAKPGWKANSGLDDAILAGGKFAFSYGLSEGSGSGAGKKPAKKTMEEAAKELASLFPTGDKIM